MKKFFIFVILSTISLYSNNINNKLQKEVQKVIEIDEQRKIFEQLQKNKNIEPSKFYDVDKIKIEEKIDKNCIKIKNIKVIGSTIYDKDDFKSLITPLINTCKGMTQLNNLAKKISNMYIEDGYVTSRAYIKAQNLSKGEIVISILEGKINSIETSLKPDYIFQELEENILNMRDLETGIEQVERLKSQKVDLEILAAEKMGYSDIKVIKSDNGNPYYGNIAVNNFGVKGSGKYQFSGNFSYENLLNLNDIISLGINTTDKVNRSTSSLGNSLSYSFPLSKFLLSLEYSSFEYKQKIPAINTYYKTNGISKSIAFNLNYKYYHSLKDRVEFYFNIKNKNHDNYYNGVFLEVQSYDLNILTLGTKYSSFSDTMDIYTSLSYQKSLLSQENQYFDTNFNKYVLDMNLTKYLNSQLRFNSSFYGQYSSNNLAGTESISIGGPYSVRGFNQNDISGNSGFYIRNELSLSDKNEYFQYSPYLAIDYGFIERDDYGTNNNSILGSAMGIRINKSDFFMDMFYSVPIKNHNESEIRNDFLGINISYNF